MYTEGEELLGQMIGDEKIKGLLDKAKGTLWKLWEETMAQLGIEGDVQSFMDQGSEIWGQLDGEVLSSAFSTLLRGEDVYSSIHS